MFASRPPVGDRVWQQTISSLEPSSTKWLKKRSQVSSKGVHYALLIIYGIEQQDRENVPRVGWQLETRPPQSGYVLGAPSPRVIFCPLPMKSSLQIGYSVTIHVGNSSIYNVALLTLGAHAQRGLRYLVCVCVCVSVCVCVCYSTSHFSHDYLCHKRY